METRLAYMKQDAKSTVIYRGSCKHSGAEPTWQRKLSRVSRPLSTVILSEDKKKQLIDDITDYLAPATHRWYANRGIPYRRGYLLYGPPGTGKSSFSLALAGHFKMRIYIVSLSSLSSSEENLSTLFADLPRRCVVLLEDIDTTGLTNTRETPAKPADGKEPAPESQPSGSATVAGSLGRLSLSGLLNILDGVASQEGRILIMTTNHLEKLDKALIRPGRVDMTIEFGLADNEISASIFNAIYTKLEADADVPRKPEAGPLPDQSEKRLEGKRAEDGDDEKKMKALALEFAAAVPVHEFSPAEIQGYLLRYKRSPVDAVANIGDWVLEMRKQKNEKALEKKEERTAEKETPGEEPTKGSDETGGKSSSSLPEDVNGTGPNGV